MRRREFLGLLAATAAVQLSARAQEARDRVRRLGVLAVSPPTDAAAQLRASTLTEALAARDWKDGANLRIDWRNGGGGDPALIARLAGELVASSPDVLLAIGSPCVEELRRRTSTIPIVFAVVTDPVSQGMVASLAHPGGNITGFTDYDGPMAGKWLDMLTEITPRPSRVAVLYNPATAPVGPLMRTLEDDARSSGVTLRDAPVHDSGEIAFVLASVAADKVGAMLVLPDFFTLTNRTAILAAAAHAGLPAVYWNRMFVTDGGLMSYGTDNDDLVRRAADYIDRILKGAKAGELPIQNPTKFDLSINLRTARALGVTISPTLLATADEVID